MSRLGPPVKALRVLISALSESTTIWARKGALEFQHNPFRTDPTPTPTPNPTPTLTPTPTPTPFKAQQMDALFGALPELEITQEVTQP